MYLFFQRGQNWRCYSKVICRSRWLVDDPGVDREQGNKRQDKSMLLCIGFFYCKNRQRKEQRTKHDAILSNNGENWRNDGEPQSQTQRKERGTSTVPKKVGMLSFNINHREEINTHEQEEQIVPGGTDKGSI